MRSVRVIAIRNDRPDHILDCVVGGNYVFILHDDGTQASYFHFMQFGVKVSVGNEVAQGQLIGLSGNSGCSSGPHTHVQINRDRYHLSREYSMPFNFNNADGPLNAKRGLVQDGIYTAL